MTRSVCAASPLPTPHSPRAGFGCHVIVARSPCCSNLSCGRPDRRGHEVLLIVPSDGTYRQPNYCLRHRGGCTPGWNVGFPCFCFNLPLSGSNSYLLSINRTTQLAPKQPHTRYIKSGEVNARGPRTHTPRVGDGGGITRPYNISSKTAPVAPLRLPAPARSSTYKDVSALLHDLSALGASCVAARQNEVKCAPCWLPLRLWQKWRRHRAQQRGARPTRPVPLPGAIRLSQAARREFGDVTPKEIVGTNAPAP